MEDPLQLALKVLDVPLDLPEDPTLSYRPRDPRRHAVDGHDATATPSPDRLAPQSELRSGYELRHVIAVGGAGEVWEAEQNSLGRVVAVKRIRQERLIKHSSKPDSIGSLIHEFEQESLTAANLEHPNILPVHDLSVDCDGMPILAMKRVHGTPWIDLLKKDYNNLSLDEHLSRHIPILLSMAQAVAFAHSRGIIHRDLKPSQVMVGEYGEVFLMDWGLAVLYDIDRFTAKSGPPPVPFAPLPENANNPAGTPVYMAPEQTIRSGSRIGPWTDVYLLGGVLYYVLTGLPPHPAKGKEETFRLAAKGFVIPLEEAAPDANIPKVLRALVTDCLQAKMEQRPQTAEEFVERLKDYITGNSRRQESEKLTKALSADYIQAERQYMDYVSALGKLANATALWPGNPDIPFLQKKILKEYASAALKNGDLTMARTQAEQLPEGDTRTRLLSKIHDEENLIRIRERQRRVAGVAAFILFVTAIGAAIIAFNQARIAESANVQLGEAVTQLRDKSEQLERKNQVAEAMTRKAAREQYFAAIGYANATLLEYNTRRIRDLLDSSPPEFRNWEWHFLDKAISQQKEILEFPRQLLCVAYSPDGKYLAFGGENQSLYMTDLETGERFELPGHQDKIYSCDFSPDGRYVATASKDRTAIVHDIETGEVIHQLTGHTDFVNTVDFDTTSTRLVTASSDNTARIWNLETGTSIVLSGHALRVSTAYFNSTGDKVITSSGDRTVRIWDSESGEELLRHEIFGEDGLTSARWNPDETLIAVTRWGSAIDVIHADKGDVLYRMEAHNDNVWKTLFEDDGSILYAASHDGTVSAWDMNTGQFLFRLVGHRAGVWGLARHPSRPLMATAGYDWTGRIWDVRAMDPRGSEIAREEIPEDAHIDTLQMINNNDGSLQRADTEWRPREEAEYRRTGGHYYRIEHGSAVFHPSGNMRVMINQPPKVIDANTGELIADMGEGRVKAAEFSPDGKYLAVCSENAELWSTQLWTEYFELPKSNNVDLVTFSNDSRYLAAYTRNGSIDIWDVENREQLSTMDGGRPIGTYVMKFSPDGTLLAVGESPSYNINIFEVATGQKRAEMEGHTYRIWSLAFSPDSSRVASAAWDSTIRLWESHTGREVLIMDKRWESLPLGVGFSDDGKRLYAPLSNGYINVWSAE